jgi:filamentous hemagglutinin
LFTVRGGDIRAMVSDSFLVNQSRVFTLFGGDILVWADLGSIDAGSGAKTVSATPPPVLVIRNGQIVLDTSNSVSGSGIGALASRADTPPSDLDLFAPQGAIDAGDAGLRSTGNVNLGARVILNAANIQAGGSVAGAPPALPAAAPPPALPNEPTAAGSRADDAAQESAARAGAGRAILTVEVIEGNDDAAPAKDGCRTVEDGEDCSGKEKGRAATS